MFGNFKVQVEPNITITTDKDAFNWLSDLKKR
jgi:hypothetical protein